MMSEYKVMNDYVIFDEVNSDSIGINHRVGALEERKVTNHHLLTDVYPFISGSPDIWKRVNILMEGIRKSNIPNLYSPTKIIKEEDRALLIYPHMKGQTFEKLLGDSTQKDIPINFDLTFSIAIAIADLIDTGSSIVVSGQKSFHGFLTPDNILIDYDGKIYLKNYGIFPYLSKTEELFNEMINKYGAWVAPEFLRKERLVPQSDIYHLGYIVYRILTGEYFSFSEGEDFESKFASIGFSQHLPSSEKDFLTNLITFFKKTLHPDPIQRFANMKEFKDYIAHFFHIEELSSVTFSLAYFMNSLYMEAMETENKQLEEEAAYSLPEEKVEDAGPDGVADSRLAEDILAGLNEKKSSKVKIIIPIIAALVIVIAVGIFYIMQSQKAAKEREAAQIKSNREMKARFAKLAKEQELEKQRIADQLKAMQEKTATTEEEKKTQEEELKKIREKQKLLEQKEQERIKAEQDAVAKQKELAVKLQKEQDDVEKQRIADEEKKKKEAEIKRLEEERNKVIVGQLVPLLEAVKPVKVKGKDPIFPRHIKKKYAANKNITLRAVILIDENGAVTNVRILTKTPEDLKSIITKTLKKWQYSPATKNNVKVKVWMSVSLKISF
ncbi:MAG: protein kinase [bacterium]|nr:protein kinase [bacterium]